MDEFVSKKLLVAKFNELASKYTDEDKRQRGLAYATAADIIAFTDAADVQPVKRGKWEYEDTIGGMKHYHCTNCDDGNECIADENQILWWRFCPKCGAKMLNE